MVSDGDRRSRHVIGTSDPDQRLAFFNGYITRFMFDRQVWWLARRGSGGVAQLPASSLPELALARC